MISLLNSTNYEDAGCNAVSFGGAVGIHLENQITQTISVSVELQFNIFTTKANPGQSIDAYVKVKNDGDSSGATTGSAFYIRAHFAVYTNLGITAGGTEDEDAATLNSSILYNGLKDLITSSSNASNQFDWTYYSQTGSMPLSTSGVSTTDTKYYVDGTQYDTAQTGNDRGYFYLCLEGSKRLMPLYYGDSVELWNTRYVLPWRLRNYTADKTIYVAVIFEAIQTFIPIVDGTGVIDPSPDNRLVVTSHEYDNNSIQIVFASCNNTSAYTEVTTDVTTVFGAKQYVCASTSVVPIVITFDLNGGIVDGGISSNRQTGGSTKLSLNKDSTSGQIE